VKRRVEYKAHEGIRHFVKDETHPNLPTQAPLFLQALTKSVGKSRPRTLGRIKALSYIIFGRAYALFMTLFLLKKPFTFPLMTHPHLPSQHFVPFILSYSGMIPPCPLNDSPFL
jgi:hypothetical protein